VFAPIVARSHGVELRPQVFVVAGTLIGRLLPAVVINRIVDGPAGGASAVASRGRRVGLGPLVALALAGVPPSAGQRRAGAWSA
jgi:hypothetical protein